LCVLCGSENKQQLSDEIIQAVRSKPKPRRKANFSYISDMCVCLYIYIYIHTHTVYTYMRVCVCVCVRERERERVSRMLSRAKQLSDMLHFEGAVPPATRILNLLRPCQVSRMFCIRCAGLKGVARVALGKECDSDIPLGGPARHVTLSAARHHLHTASRPLAHSAT